MTISYNWLSEYLPVKIEPERLSRILTSVGLEVEKMERYEEVKGGLQGLVIGEVLEAVPHPNADKLRLTRVSIGRGEPLAIVCGAPNVAAGQKVVVATVGTTIYPSSGEPLTMKVARIRGEESHGMICAEDEIGLGDSHAGILVLPADTTVGMEAAAYFRPYTDIIYEIGLTPNRMDAMSHWGVARDVCAYLAHHDKRDYRPVLPAVPFKVDNHNLSIKVDVKAPAACPRYAGVCLDGLQVGESPRWLQDRLRAIGLRPINNIVDITNYIQHETGQPLHAFDYDAIRGGKVVVQQLPEGSLFTTLDEKERKLSAEDLMICDAEGGMCIAGVFGGRESGVKETTKRIFLESAFFDPGLIRKTSFRHGLRTDAATRFEKGIDISATVSVLKRAALLIRELAGGTIASDIIDIYPEPEAKREIVLKYQYLKKLSGKNYHPDSVRQILTHLGFTVRESGDSLLLEVPHHKRDVSLPADAVEEILRIDGLDNIDIPVTISIAPSVEEDYRGESLKEKTAQVLTGLGFSEILTNSITNAAYLPEEGGVVRLLNALSSELNVLRASMVHTALEVIAFNLNRKNADLRLFEFGKTYATGGAGRYSEQPHLCLYLTGALSEPHWRGQRAPADLLYLKGVANALLSTFGLQAAAYEPVEDALLQSALQVRINTEYVLRLGQVDPALAARFDIRQPVYFADIYWDRLLKATADQKVQFSGIPRYPAVERDLALVVDRGTSYGAIEEGIRRLRLKQLRSVRLFDVFESEKLGADKKSMAINLTFQDTDKTLTDKEIDGWMGRIMTTLEKEVSAEIRK